MKYLVWYDVWLKGEEKDPGSSSSPSVWHSFKSNEEARQHVERLSNRAFLDGRTITITIKPQE